MTNNLLPRPPGPDEDPACAAQSCGHVRGPACSDQQYVPGWRPPHPGPRGGLGEHRLCRCRCFKQRPGPARGTPRWPLKLRRPTPPSFSPGHLMLFTAMVLKVWSRGPGSPRTLQVSGGNFHGIRALFALFILILSRGPKTHDVTAEWTQVREASCLLYSQTLKWSAKAENYAILLTEFVLLSKKFFHKNIIYVTV